MDDIKKLIEALQCGRWVGGEIVALQAAEALERLSAENAALRARLEAAEADLTATYMVGLEAGKDATKAELQRVRAEAAVMRGKVEAAIKAFASLYVEGGGADVVDSLLQAAPSTAAGDDLLAEVRRLREVERLARAVMGGMREHRSLDGYEYIGEWQPAKALFAALGEEE